MPTPGRLWQLLTEIYTFIHSVHKHSSPWEKVMVALLSVSVRDQWILNHTTSWPRKLRMDSRKPHVTLSPLTPEDHHQSGHRWGWDIPTSWNGRQKSFLWCPFGLWAMHDLHFIMRQQQTNSDRGVLYKSLVNILQRVRVMTTGKEWRAIPD
jgi:hypothetical protein